MTKRRRPVPVHAASLIQVLRLDPKRTRRGTVLSVTALILCLSSLQWFSDLHKEKGPQPPLEPFVVFKPVRLVPRLFVPVFLLWQDFECVLRGWAWQCPLQRVRIFVPWVVLGHFWSTQQ